MKPNSGFRCPARAAVAAVLLLVALAGCSSASAHSPAASQPGAGFAGYKWAVVTISHDGRATPVAVKYAVYLQFTPDGHFGANEPVNYHSGRYELTPGGFTTSDVAQTLVGYAGRDPVVLLSVSAISAVGSGSPALARVSGSTLTVTAGGYTLTARRDGKQPNF
jgi:hypothetical protein